MKMYEGPDLPRPHVPNCKGDRHCCCKRLVSGQAYCCRCGYQPKYWFEVVDENPHNDKLLNNIQYGGQHAENNSMRKLL